MKHLLISSFIIVAFTVRAQDDCKVSLDSLKGTYTGECKNGKANGNGKAVGIHSYEGGFKNGIPEGKGKYTWSNGDYYEGTWKKGEKEGKGELHQFRNGKANVTRGYWKKNKYRGEYEHSYMILSTTNDIGRVEVNLVSPDDNTISVSVSSMSSSTQSPTSNSFQTSTVMTSHQVVRGFYISKASSALTNKEITTFRGVEFPFRCIFTFGNAVVEIEFFEKGAWDVAVPITR